MADGQNSRPHGGRPERRQRRRSFSPADKLKQRQQYLDVERTNRKLKVLALVCASFFFLWLFLKVFAQADFWPLLAAPILLSAWFFYEVGVIVTLGITGLLLIQTPLDQSGSVMISVFSFAVIGLGIAWAQRRRGKAQNQMLKMSLTDALTGLYNFGYFMEALDREIHRAERYGGSVTLVMFDIDHFKSFNDRFGHQAGNEALKAVAKVIRREKRESDIAARYGGEEFVLILPGEEAAGTETAGRLRQALSMIQVPVGGGAAAGFTVSAGVASYPLGASSKEELVERVDRLLYISKRSGRNRVSVASAKNRLAV